MSIINKLIGNVVGGIYDLTCGNFPATVRIETTNHCNARCTICPHKSMSRKAGIMDDALYRNIVDECVTHNCHTLHLHNFGEPLLDKNLSQRIVYAKQQGIQRIKIFTNGSLLVEPIISQLLESGIDEIKISIDGADKEEFESIRCGLNYDQIIGNIKKFIVARNDKGLTLPKVIVTCCTTSDQACSKDKLCNIVDRYDFGKIHNWGDQSKSFHRKLRKPCSRLWQTFTVLYNGDVALCCLDWDGKVILGNVKQEGSLAKIWRNSCYKKLRSYHRRAMQHKIAICKNCSKSYF
jgi:MoaA/NifB/PqqE/SkfB family radical SAM enzyme